MTNSTTKPFSDDFWLGVITPPMIVVGLVPTIILRAWVLTVLWGWYVVPAFGLAPLRIVFAFGLATIIAAFRGSSRSETKTTLAVSLASSAASSLVSLGIGWVGSFFV